MKTLLLLTFIFFSFSTFASIDAIKISSFIKIGDMRTPMLGALCGKVDFTNELTAQVLVTVDPNSGNFTYNTTTDSNGYYCLNVATYDGAVQATARSLKNGVNTKAKLPQATAELK